MLVYVDCEVFDGWGPVSLFYGVLNLMFEVSLGDLFEKV